MLTTRTVTQEDKQFLWHLKVASMRDYVSMVYGGWDDDTQYHQFFENRFKPEQIQIIQWHGQDVGMYRLQEEEKDWFLAQIEILPAFQGKRIGSQFIERLIQNATLANKSIRLQVFKINPARNLYKRLGFIQSGETETHIQMIFANG